MKVIGFDCWTQGARHYARLKDAFARKGLELSLVHLGSWGDEPGRPAEERIGTLQVRDIAYYGSKTLREVLETENPDAVVFTSTDAFAHRAFSRYCRARGVPTLHLFHGLQHLMEIPFKSSPLKRFWMMRRHVPKLLWRFLPAYVRSLRETSATRAEWLELLRDLADRARGSRSKRAAADSATDRACVYVDADIEVAVQRYHHARQHVVAVGNPDLTSLGLGADAIASRVRDTRESRDVVYIDTALIAYGFVYESDWEFVQHVVATHDAMAAQGKRLVFKPHPAQKLEVVTAIAQSGVEICATSDFVTRLQGACACITEPSSAALIPALIGLPLMLAQYGKLGGQFFGEMLHHYPRARGLQEPGRLTEMLAEEFAAMNSAATTAWITQNTGPLPAEAMPDRVADTMLAAINDKLAGRRAG